MKKSISSPLAALGSFGRFGAFRRFALGAVTLGLIVPHALAGPTVPTGLSPGNHYYLAFVTRDSRDGTSTNIADYNAFAQNQAALDPSLTGTDRGVTWNALASTAANNAFNNLAIGAFPVYLVDGTTKIATGGADLWDGSILSPLDIDQFGHIAANSQVFTGSNTNGTSAGAAGSRALGTTIVSSDISNGPGVWVNAGQTFRTNTSWINSSGAQNPGSSNQLYAFSQLLTVPVPEPSSMVLFGLGALGALALRCLGRKSSFNSAR